jgi:L-lactate dehydrogenase complex protein LldE
MLHVMAETKNTIPSAPKMHVGLFATCLVDLMRPVIGFATLKLLEDAGCCVSVPAAQTCCGQPAYNAGDSKDARAIASQVIETFEAFDYVVAPSGSCAGMLKIHYPVLFKNDDAWKVRAENLSARTFELSSFLNDVLKVTSFDTSCSVKATYHDGCSGLRELGIKKQPRALLKNIKGLDITEAAEAESCCGFGGLFCVKYADISTHIVDAKIDDALKTKADVLVGGDLGCLMNIAGRLQRRGLKMEVRHFAEILSGHQETTPAIGEDDEATEKRLDRGPRS